MLEFSSRAMHLRALCSWTMAALLGSCGARTGSWLPDPLDAAAPDVFAPDAVVPDVPARGCTLRMLDGPVPALSHDGSDKGPWIGPRIVFRNGAFDAVATLQAEDDDTFSQARAMRFRYSPGAGVRVEVAPRVLFAATSPTYAIAQGDALAMCRLPSSGGMAAEVVRYGGAYERLAESRTFLGATGTAGLAAASDTLLVATEIMGRTGAAEVWLARANREGAGLESLGPALLETPRAGVGVGVAAHPDGARYFFASAVRRGGFVELGEVQSRSMGGVRRRRVVGFRYDAAAEAVAPAMAFWPDGASLAMVPAVRTGDYRMERVNLAAGTTTSIELGATARAGSPPPALVSTPQGLFVALLHSTEGAPTSAELELIRVDADTATVTGRVRVPVPTAAPQGASTGVSLTAGGDFLIVHWSGATSAPTRLRQTFLAAFDCSSR